MLYKFIMLTLIGMLPAIGFSQNTEDSHVIEKQKLTCLYKRIDEYLNRKNDPVMVVLASVCTELMIGKDDSMRSFYVPDPLPYDPSQDYEDSTLTASDVYMLTKEQLKCFKKKFENSISNNPNNAIHINFNNICQ